MIADSAENVDGWEKVLSAAISKAALPETANAAVQVAKRNTERARRDALIAIAQDIPDPAEYARYISDEVIAALRSAHERPNGSYSVPHQVASFLRPLGLVEYGGRCLTAFGIAVRFVLVEAAE